MPPPDSFYRFRREAEFVLCPQCAPNLHRGVCAMATKSRPPPRVPRTSRSSSSSVLTRSVLAPEVACLTSCRRA